MIVREEYPLSAVEAVLKKDISVVIIGTSSCEERCQKIKDTFQDTGAMIVAVDYKHDEGKFHFSVLTDPLPSTFRPTKERFANLFASKLKGHDKNVLIDLTSLQHPVIIVLLNILFNKIRPAHLFAAYVKPKQYINRDELGKYNLTIGVSEPAGIPGLIRQRKDDEIVIPFLGFEGDRLHNIIEDMTYDSIIPIIGFPSEDPSWQFESLRNCMQVLESACPDAEIRKCKSNSIYDAIATLDEINALYPEKNFVLLPLGIRPHTAACGIWAAKHKNARVLYDYVVESDKRSVGTGDVIVYHLSRYI